MFKLNASLDEPFWLEILPAQVAKPAKGKKPKVIVPSQRTQFVPVTMAMLLVAREAASKAVLAATPMVSGPDAAPPSPVATMYALAQGEVTLVVTLAQLGIKAWEGVGDADNAPVEPTPERIAAYMSDYRIHDAVYRLYVQPQLNRADEKNVSAPSRNGTSGAKIPAGTTAASAK